MCWDMFIKCNVFIKLDADTNIYICNVKPPLIWYNRAMVKALSVLKSLTKITYIYIDIYYTLYTKFLINVKCLSQIQEPKSIISSASYRWKNSVKNGCSSGCYSCFNTVYSLKTLYIGFKFYRKLYVVVSDKLLTSAGLGYIGCGYKHKPCIDRAILALRTYNLF